MAWVEQELMTPSIIFQRYHLALHLFFLSGGAISRCHPFHFFREVPPRVAIAYTTFWRYHIASPYPSIPFRKCNLQLPSLLLLSGGAAPRCLPFHCFLEIPLHVAPLRSLLSGGCHLTSQSPPGRYNRALPSLLLSRGATSRCRPFHCFQEALQISCSRMSVHATQQYFYTFLHEIRNQSDLRA